MLPVVQLGQLQIQLQIQIGREKQRQLDMFRQTMPLVDIAAETAGFGMTTGDLKIWFGILALVVVEVGLITPPVGMNVFVISSIADNCDISDTFKGVSPFFIAELIRIVILVSLPILALWLPNILTG